MGAGILHTKLWLVDRRHFYVGSANFDWRSLTQVKEMGVLVMNCPTMAQDMAKIFDVYWELGGSGKEVPPAWPSSLSTKINAESPLR
jgi:phospholipase D3/4